MLKLKFSHLFVLLTGVILFLGNSGGRATVADQGNTGAPGDNFRTCQNCHNSVSIQVRVEMDFQDMDGKSVSHYIPGEIYKVIVKVDPAVGTPAGYGFQLVCLNAPIDENGNSYNAWSEQQANVKIVSTSSGRIYAEHDGVSASNTFEVMWHAPNTEMGKFSFYAGGNGVNLNGQSSGDGATVNKMEISDITTSVSNNTPMPLSIYPNPSVGPLRISPLSGTGEIEIFTVGGQKLWSKNAHVLTVPIDPPLKAGIYFLRVKTADGKAYLAKLLRQ